VGACLASAADGFSTAAAVNAGGREVNSLFRTDNGGISYGRMITLKSLTCAVPIILSETLHRSHPDRRTEFIGFAGSALMTGLYSTAATRNYQLSNQLNIKAGTVPDYLK
jgi:hypothetical protein